LWNFLLYKRAPSTKRQLQSIKDNILPQKTTQLHEKEPPLQKSPFHTRQNDSTKDHIIPHKHNSTKYKTTPQKSLFHTKDKISPQKSPSTKK